MMVPAEPAPVPPVQPPSAQPNAGPKPTAPAPAQPNAGPKPAAPPRAAAAPPDPVPDDGLIAPAAAAAATQSMSALMRTLANERNTAVHRGGPTLEDLVRDEMRPMLKEWLDVYLPPIVERLVRAEIERVVSRMAG